MATQTFDINKFEAFAERMLDILNSGAIVLMTAIEHRTELFDIMAELPPSTSQQIADAAGLNELSERLLHYQEILETPGTWDISALAVYAGFA